MAPSPIVSAGFALRLKKIDRVGFMVPETDRYIGCGTCAKLFSDRTRALTDHAVKTRMPGH